MKAEERKRIWIIARAGQGSIEQARQVARECRLWRGEGIERDMSYAYRVAGIPAPKVMEAPFRAPHHTVSEAALVGSLSGHRWFPGEVGLSHGGVLVLDQATEFRRVAVEAVARAFELGFVQLHSSVPSTVGERRVEAHNVLVMPTLFSLVVITPPCPCGNRAHPKLSCSCSERQVEKFHERVYPLVQGAEVIRL